MIGGKGPNIRFVVVALAGLGATVKYIYSSTKPKLARVAWLHQQLFGAPRLLSCGALQTWSQFLSTAITGGIGGAEACDDDKALWHAVDTMAAAAQQWAAAQQ